MGVAGAEYSVKMYGKHGRRWKGGRTRVEGRKQTKETTNTKRAKIQKDKGLDYTPRARVAFRLMLGLGPSDGSCQTP